MTDTLYRKSPDIEQDLIHCCNCQHLQSVDGPCIFCDNHSNFQFRNAKEVESALNPINDKEKISTMNTEGSVETPLCPKTLCCQECGCLLDPLTGVPDDTAAYREIGRLNAALDNLSAQHAELLERYEILLERFVEETSR